MELNRQPLSVYFIVKNEELRLPESLAQAVKVADELIVVDSGSNDRTIEIAKSFGAKVVYHDWTGFAAQKAYAASLCQHDWVLDLDADEVLSDELVQNIKTALVRPDIDDFAGFKMRWVYVPPFKGHPMVFAKDQWILRFYNKTKAAIVDAEFSNNDRPQLNSGKVENLAGDVLHKSLITLDQLERKYSLLTSNQAADYVQIGRSISTFRLIVELPLKFLKYYIVDQQFRNGWYGFCVAVISANRNFMRFAKAKELLMMKKSESQVP
ncbi:MAG: glycosyltransferase family 2 protein [Moraxellaceae bacterium]|nr:glycosyltransferase family 2 protein [Moraxellaceae bacterium]MDZ4386743.1 glycosyltransferase family 2 protein [Moraxellaceae bacterium]